MPDELYCYPDSNVLKNKIGIRDLERFHEMERKLTMLRILELLDKPVRGAFDLKHLQAIHAYIFQDVYDWAGKLRKVDIAKGNMFCNAVFLSEQAEEIFGKLKAEDYLHGLDKDNFVVRLAYYFSEINALHPFRDGNGRSQREFIRCLALHNGYVISFANASRVEMLEASRKSFLCEYGAMERLFEKCLRKS
ncbi:MAG: Fic family protein [Lachnospiraceae bacterium]|nr:Fic family protein [Lachnospiraceae bacterium]